jgi:hypothetical protein
MKRYLAIAIVGLTLAGCANTPPAEGLRLSCEAFTAELNILAPLRADGTLSANVINIVDTQKAATDAICDAPAPMIDASVGKVAVDAGVKVLTSVAAEFITK